MGFRVLGFRGFSFGQWHACATDGLWGITEQRVYGGEGGEVHYWRRGLCKKTLRQKRLLREVFHTKTPRAPIHSFHFALQLRIRLQAVTVCSTTVDGGNLAPLCKP